MSSQVSAGALQSVLPHSQSTERGQGASWGSIVSQDQPPFAVDPHLSHHPQAPATTAHQYTGISTPKTGTKQDEVVLFSTLVHISTCCLLLNAADGKKKVGKKEN